MDGNACIVESFTQPSRAYSSKLVTPLPIVRLARLEQSWNALAPTLPTPLPIVTLDIPEHPENAPVERVVVASGITTLPTNPVQPLNALAPMEVTLFGIVTLVKHVQLMNALAFIVVIVDGMTRFVRRLPLR